MDKEFFNIKWKQLTEELSTQFQQDVDLTGILFLVGVQEYGEGFRKFSREEKFELINLASCKLLSRYGYYNFESIDKEGFPIWIKNPEKENISLDKETKLLKKSIIEYFTENEVL
mgnify:CR=1 FL=1